MAELQQKTALEVDDGFVCRDHEGYVERMKAQALGREDPAWVRNTQRARWWAFSGTPGWKHDRGLSLHPPDKGAQRRRTFEELVPEQIGPTAGMPRLVPRGHLQFNAREVACVRGGEGGPMATKLWGARGFDDGAVGQEVNALFQWLRTQEALVEPISNIALPVMLELQTNGILDDDFRVVGAAHIDALLYDLARSGRVDAYPVGAEEHATKMLGASRALTETEIAQAKHAATIQQYAGRVDALKLRANAASAALDAWLKRRDEQAEQRNVAALIRERDNKIKLIDGLSGMATGCSSAIQGVNAASLLTKGAGIASGVVGVVSSAAKMIIHHAYEADIDAAYDRIGQLRREAEASEAHELSQQLRALEVEVDAFRMFVAEMGQISEQIESNRTIAYAELGSRVAPAMRAMKGGAIEGRDVLPHDTGGDLQRLVSNMLVYEKIQSFARSAVWPRLTGDVPMSGYLYWSMEALVLADMAQEAAKLRWWQDRTHGVCELLHGLRQAIASIGPNTRKL